MSQIPDTTVHHLDLASKAPISVEFQVLGTDIKNYLEMLKDQILNEKRSRAFRFATESSEVCRALRASHADERGRTASSDAIAHRLLREERAAQDRHRHLTTLRKGSLVQSWVQHAANNHYIIAKVDHDAFLDGDDLTRRIGLPYAKQALKSCLIEFDAEGQISSVRVSDSNARISEYWWKEFLGLEPINTDEANTRNAWKSLEKTLTRKLKVKHKADYMYLRNNLIGYFRTQAEFDWSTLLQAVIGSYSPEDSSLDVDQLRQDIEKLPEDKGFDRQFSIESSAVSKQMKTVIRLSESIDLTLKRDVSDLKTVITPVEESGIKYLKIRTDEGYNAFYTPSERQ